MATIKLPKADVVIVGMGAAGGVGALPLAKAGMKVIGLEAGPRLDQRAYPSDETGSGTWTSIWIDDERTWWHVDSLQLSELALRPVDVQGT